MTALCRDCFWFSPPLRSGGGGPAKLVEGVSASVALERAPSVTTLSRRATSPVFDRGGESRRCPSCNSPRLIVHPELETLPIAHLDCDAFYATVEKRDRPELRDEAVIVGGGKRGVVATCCYIARTYGVRSAMPMFKALKACPHATVIKPDFRKYVFESRRIMAMLESLTPLVQPLSLDEAWLDLSGSERLHGGPAALTLARMQNRIEEETGLTVSIGLAANKFLAKIASDLDKPRGFSVIGAEAKDFLNAQTRVDPARRRAGLRQIPGKGGAAHRWRHRPRRSQGAGGQVRRLGPAPVPLGPGRGCARGGPGFRA